MAASSSFVARPRLAAQLDALPPRPEEVTGDDMLSRFLDYVKESGLELYPAQEEALLEIISGKNVILATPTGSGKSLVAIAMHFVAMAKKKRSFYTSPIKALASEKFFALCREIGPENVGMLTGDATINHDAPIICCTAEILANMALREGADADVDYVIMDEFHYYADRDRGVAWQVPLLTLKHATFLLMSATLGDVTFFEEKLTALTGKPTAVVRSTHRPVPLDFAYKEIALHETILELTKSGRSPIYVVSFTQRGCAEEAQNLMSVDYCTKEEKKAIGAALEGFRFDSPYGKELSRFIRHGIGLHHAGLLPKYRLLVEKLAQKGHLKIICGTDTLGVGVNIPIRTVLFTKLCKYDGEKTGILSVRDFQQISGRAGRKGFDEQGSVVAQAPEHVIENIRLEAKAGNDPAKKRKIVKRKPPERGYAHWDKATFERLITSPPEPLVSRFQVTHGMLLNVLERPSGGCKTMARLIRDSHEKQHAKRQQGRTAIAMFKSLLDAGIIEIGEDHRVVVNADLQEDFSLNHALSLYLLETIDALKKDENPEYALDLLTLVESILENPEIVLMKQLDKMKTEKMAEMKAAGVEYDDRIAELEKMEYPKPNREFIYATFNDFAKKHPWVGENIRPKSVARDMYERFMSFGEYVREYELQRAEGALLRYLSDVYKALVQAVPTLAKTADFDEIETYFGAIVRAADSSLLDEWERMRGAGPEIATAVRDEAPGEIDITRNEKEFTVLVRNALFALVRAIARKEWEAAAALLEARDANDAWTATRIEAALAPFFAEHASVRLDPKARAPVNTRVTSKDGGLWRVEHVICDAEEANDWALACVIDLARSAVEGHVVLDLERVVSGA
jgi:superfamily II RNA helicase